MLPTAPTWLSGSYATPNYLSANLPVAHTIKYYDTVCTEPASGNIVTLNTHIVGDVVMSAKSTLYGAYLEIQILEVSHVGLLDTMYNVLQPYQVCP